jgi:hypothetical protein
MAGETMKSGFQGGGAALGAAVGGAVDVATGGATAGLGSVLGALIGGILGNLLDELIEALGVVTPIIDAFAVVIDALTPLLLAFGDAFSAIGIIIEAFAPVIHALADPLSEVVMLFANLLLTLAPLISIVLHVVAALLEFGLNIAMSTPLLDMLNEHWRNGLDVFDETLNGFVDLYNAIIDLIRTVPGMADFGMHMEHFDLGLDAIDYENERLTDALDRNTNELRDMNREVTNIPAGYKTNLAIFNATDPRSSWEAFQQQHGDFIIQNVNIGGMTPEQFEQWMRRQNAARRGGANAGAPTRDRNN